jgi:CAAX protease family protein
MTEIPQANFKTKYIFKSVLFCIVFTGLLVVFSFFKSFIPNKFERFAYGTIATAVSFLTTYLFLRFDKKPFADVGLKFENSTVRKFCVGILIGVGLMGLMTMSVIYFSGFKIELNKNSNLLNFLFWTSPLILLALMEEVGFRAYPLVILKDKVGIRASIIITSILFALYHIPNGWTISDAFFGPAILGLIFGLAATYSNGIAMPTGIHYAINLTTSAFGAINNTVSIWTIRQSNTPTLASHQGTDFATRIPNLCLLVFAIICLELYVGRKNYR